MSDENHLLWDEEVEYAVFNPSRFTSLQEAQQWKMIEAKFRGAGRVHWTGHNSPKLLRMLIECASNLRAIRFTPALYCNLLEEHPTLVAELQEAEIRIGRGSRKSGHSDLPQMEGDGELSWEDPLLEIVEVSGISLNACPRRGKEIPADAELVQVKHEPLSIEAVQALLDHLTGLKALRFSRGAYTKFLRRRYAVQLLKDRDVRIGYGSMRGHARRKNMRR